MGFPSVRLRRSPEKRMAIPNRLAKKHRTRSVVVRATHRGSLLFFAGMQVVLVDVDDLDARLLALEGEGVDSVHGFVVINCAFPTTVPKTCATDQGVITRRVEAVKQPLGDDLNIGAPDLVRQTRQGTQHGRLVRRLHRRARPKHGNTLRARDGQRGGYSDVATLNSVRKISAFA